LCQGKGIHPEQGKVIHDPECIHRGIKQGGIINGGFAEKETLQGIDSLPVGHGSRNHRGTKGIYDPGGIEFGVDVCKRIHEPVPANLQHFILVNSCFISGIPWHGREKLPVNLRKPCLIVQLESHEFKIDLVFGGFLKMGNGTLFIQCNIE